MSKRETIAEAETTFGHVSVVKHDDLYDVCVDRVIKQPNHDADGAIRALCHYLHGSEYRKLKAGCV